MSTPGVPERIIATVRFITDHTVITTTVLVAPTEDDDIIDQAEELVCEELGMSSLEWGHADVMSKDAQP